MQAGVRHAAGAVLSPIVGSRLFKPVVFLACLYPGAELGWRLWTFIQGTNLDGLGVNPSQTVLHETGRTALTILLLTLTVTPVRRLLGVNRIQGVRRMLGVWSFVYAALHLTSYLVFDQLCYSVETCDFRTIWEDILKRRFIFVGQLAFVILLILAITSTTGWQRRLRKNWTRLHRLVYVAATAGIVHFIWIQKSDYTEPFRWGAWLLILLALRAGWAISRRSSRARQVAPVSSS
jgi:sulfoxide reductase heme-binding subunit YedZ